MRLSVGGGGRGVDRKVVVGFGVGLHFDLEVETSLVIGGSHPLAVELFVIVDLFVFDPIPHFVQLPVPFDFGIAHGQSVHREHAAAHFDVVSRIEGGRERVELHFKFRTLIFLHFEVEDGGIVALRVHRHGESAQTAVFGQGEFACRHSESVGGDGLLGHFFVVTVEEFHSALDVCPHLVGVAFARIDQSGILHALSRAIESTVGVEVHAPFGAHHWIAVIAETIVLITRLGRDGGDLFLVGDGLSGFVVDIGALFLVGSGLQEKERAARNRREFAFHEFVFCPQFDHIDAGVGRLELNAVGRLLMSGQGGEVLAEGQCRFVRYLCDELAQFFRPHISLGIYAVGAQLLERSVHAFETNEVDFHRLQIIPSEQCAISGRGIEGIALRLQLGRRPVDLNGRLLHFGKEVVEPGCGLSVALQSFFGQRDGFIESVFAQDLTNVRKCFGILGEFLVRLGHFSQKLLLFFRLDEVGHIELCAQSGQLLSTLPVISEIALQHSLHFLFLDGAEIVVFIRTDERGGEDTEQVVAVDPLTVCAEVKKRGVVARVRSTEQCRLLHGFEEEVVGFAHHRGVLVAPRGARFVGIEASQGIEPEGALNGTLLFGQFSFDEFAHHRTAVGCDLLLHHLFGEERAQELGGVARPEGFFAYELQRFQRRLGLIFFTRHLHVLPPPGEVLGGDQLCQTRGTKQGKELGIHGHSVLLKKQIYVFTMSYRAFIVLFSAANVNFVRNGAKQSPAMFAALLGNCIFVHGSTTAREGFSLAFRAAQSNVSDGTRLLC